MPLALAPHRETVRLGVKKWEKSTSFGHGVGGSVMISGKLGLELFWLTPGGQCRVEEIAMQHGRKTCAGVVSLALFIFISVPLANGAVHVLALTGTQAADEAAGATFTNF